MVAELKRHAVEGAETIDIYLREIGQIPLLTRKEEVELATRVQRGDKAAREHMIKANLRLVVRIAHGYQNLGLPLLDLVSEGNIGLMKAVERYNPHKGVKFSTYASWWIKQSIRRALSNQSKTIRLPVHVTDQVSRLIRLIHRLTERLGREPTDIELAAQLDLPEEKIAELRTIGIRPRSLDAPTGSDDDDTPRFGELLEDTNAATPSEQLIFMADRHDVRQQLRHLNQREAEIITMRFGLDGQEPRTLEEVGKRFKITRERIRQIQESALSKLRRRLERLARTEAIGKS
jgi:RNA polymerase primary sigma factor